MTNPSTSLREAADPAFRIGAAVHGSEHHKDAMPLVHEQRYRDVLAAEFSSLTPENQLKWSWLRPAPGEYDFAASDAIVEFAQQHGQHVRGHTLFWHNQNPQWLIDGTYSDEELRTQLREHVQTVVSRYAGRIQQWDVVNEIIDDDGTLRTERNLWIAQLGPQIIDDVFHWAHEADPTAVLFGNDYSVEKIGTKSDAWYDLCQGLLQRGVPIHGFGLQAHLDLAHDHPDDLQENLQRFADLGLRTAITELDIRGQVDADGKLSDADTAEQARRYGLVVDAARQTPGCDSFTFWGVRDEQSWIPQAFPGTGAALLFNGDFEPKPAHAVVRESLSSPAD